MSNNLRNFLKVIFSVACALFGIIYFSEIVQFVLDAKSFLDVAIDRFFMEPIVSREIGGVETLGFLLIYLVTMYAVLGFLNRSTVESEISKK